MAGGHALDLFVGRLTREHHDIDVPIFGMDAPLLHHLLVGWDLQRAHAGVLTPWTTAGADPPFNSIWCRTTPAEPWSLQLMFEEGTPAEWICRRHPDIRLPMDEIVCHSPQGVPYIAPCIQLLMKAQDTRPKDDVDFATDVPNPSPDQSVWLTDELRRLYPTLHWLG